MRFLANFISLLRNKENCSNEIISPKITLSKYLVNAKFGYCNFFPEPKVTLGKTLCKHISNLIGKYYNVSKVGVYPQKNQEKLQSYQYFEMLFG